jgi:hypothetical protein
VFGAVTDCESITFHPVSELLVRWKAGDPEAVYGELLIRQATGHATLLHPSLYVIDSKRAFSFGEAQLSHRL